MPLVLPATLRRALRSGDAVACDLMIRSGCLPPPQQLVLLAETKRLAGRFSEANAYLAQVEQPADRALQAFALRVKGELLGSAGLVPEALEVLGRVIVDGEGSPEHEQVALAALSRFTLLTNHRGLAESQQGLEQAKKAVLRSGDAQLLAALHARVGQAYAQRSLPTVAVTELSSALDLLRPEPNAYLEAFSMLALSGAEYLLARNAEAAKWARSAQRIAEKNGLLALESAATANLAFLSCRRGSFGKARVLAEKCLANSTASTLARGALLDTLANVALEEGDLETARRAIVEVETTIGTLKSANLLLVDSAPVRARYARIVHGPHQSHEILSEAMRAAEERGNVLGWAKLALLRAELLCSLRNSDGAETDVLSVVEGVHSPNAEILAFLSRARAVRGRQQNDLRRFSIEIARAKRIFLGSGDRFHAKQTSALRTSAPSELTSEFPPARRHRLHFELAESLALVGGLLAQPHIAGAEAVRILKRMNIVSSASLTINQEALEVPSQSIVLGKLGSDNVLLQVSPLQDAVSREAVAHLLGVFRLFVAAFRAQTESRRTALSWDLDAAPDGRSGLYISAQMKQLLATIRRVASSSVSVLVTGETGTGKEVVSRDLHQLSRRAPLKFIAFNVNAVPRDMLEGQLFGYRRGAFTGAVSDARGLVREAEGGTLFIDEIGELGLDVQPKLLRFLESGEIQPIGEAPLKVDVRVIVATNSNLEELVKQGKFREDLFYRLQVVSLLIPPLRERREEIPTLVNHFLTVHSEQAGKFIPQLTNQALERLCTYDWPGNIRQLSNELKRIVALSGDEDVVDLMQLSASIRVAEVQAPPSRVDGSAVHVRLDRTLQEMYDDIERAAISRAMEQSLYNQTVAARLLGITRKGLYLKRQRLGLADAPTS